MARIKLDFLDLPLAQFLDRARAIERGMNGNAAFAGIAAKLPAYAARILEVENYEKEYQAALILADEKLTLRNATRERLTADTRGLAAAAEGETRDEAELLSGGWELRSAAKSSRALGAPEDLRAMGGTQVGEVDLLWNSVRGRDVYIAELATDAAGPWTQFYVRKQAYCTATGLTPGQLYWFRVRAVGSAGNGPWSDIAQARAT